MTDVKVANLKNRFDIYFELGDLVTDEGLETAVSLSLFTDRRVLPEELSSGETERRGWWGDEFSDFDGDQIGSRLWLLDRAKISQETRNKVEEYVKEALAWLVDDGVAESIDVKAEIVNKTERIDFSVGIQRPKVKNLYYYRFQLIWEGQILNVRKAS